MYIDYSEGDSSDDDFENLDPTPKWMFKNNAQRDQYNARQESKNNAAEE